MQLSYYFNHMPNEIQNHLLSFLDEQSNCQASQVCKLWQKMCGANEMWERMFPGIKDTVYRYGYNSCKQFIGEKIFKRITSCSELESLYRSFYTRCQNKNAKFSCLLLHNRDCHVVIELKAKDMPLHEEIYLLTTPLEKLEEQETFLNDMQASSSRYEYSFKMPFSLIRSETFIQLAKAVNNSCYP